jgi:hypothetical protein
MTTPAMASHDAPPPPPTSQKCHIAKPPQPPTIHGKSVFLAGSIDSGAAPDWQSALTTSLAHLPITILNPRRDDWDATWTQDISDAKFREQVEWELDGLAAADVIAMYLAPDTRAPISLLELGLHAASGKVVVCCPAGFWRRGNVQIVCGRFGVELVEGLEELVERVVRRLEAFAGS